MPWGNADQTFLWGTTTPVASWGVPAHPPLDPNWPELPALYAPYSGNLLNYARDVRNHLLGGFGNPLVAQALDDLELALRTALAAREASSGFTLLAPGAALTHTALHSAIIDAARRTPRARGPAAAASAAKTPNDLTHHLLRDTLVAGLRAQGWWGGAAAGVPLRTAIAFLPDAAFYGEMLVHHHLKDVTVGQEHGEWTHLLQWYMLAARPPGPNFDSAALFLFLGRQGPVQRAAVVPAGHDPGPTMWQVLFDRVAPYHNDNNFLAAGAHDFGSPDMLHVSLAGFADNRQWLRAVADGRVPGIIAALDANLAHARAQWPLLTALLRLRVEKRVVLFREAQRADEALAAAVTALTDELNAMQRSDGTLLIDTATSNVRAVLAQRDQPFAANIVWNVPSLTPAERWQLNSLIAAHRKATERSAHLFQGDNATKTLLYVSSKRDRAALLNPVGWWQTVSPADRATLLAEANQLFL